MVHDDTNWTTIVTRFLLVSSRLLRTGGDAGVLGCFSKAHSWLLLVTYGINFRQEHEK